MEIANKHVFITGAAVRIGRALAEKFAELGAKVTIHYHKSESEANELLESLPGCGHSLIKADLSKRSEVVDLLKKTNKHYDILINNASLYGRKLSCLDSDIDGEEYFKVNYFAPMSLIKQFAEQPNLNSGVVINLLDQEVCRETPLGGAYAHSKRALRDATLELSKELAPNIRVNGIAPGPVFPPTWVEGKGMTKVLDSVPLQKPVNIQDLISGAIFLTTNDSITGQILYIDCGQHL